MQSEDVIDGGLTGSLSTLCEDALQELVMRYASQVGP